MSMRKVVLMARALPEYFLEELGAPTSSQVCTCEDPDIQPVGGWWPSAFVCCSQCSRPRLEP